jgi:hypothetical protein
MVTIDGIRYRIEDAKRLGLIPEPKPKPEPKTPPEPVTKKAPAPENKARATVPNKEV